MESRKLFTRRFIFGIGVLLILTGLNATLFWYVRNEASGVQWSYIEKTNGEFLFGKAELLEGGFIELTAVHALTSVNHLQGESVGEQFQLESLNPRAVTITKVHVQNSLRIGPGEVRQWGTVPLNSEIYKQLQKIHEASKS